MYLLINLTCSCHTLWLDTVTSIVVFVYHTTEPQVIQVNAPIEPQVFQENAPTEPQIIQVDAPIEPQVNVNPSEANEKTKKKRIRIIDQNTYDMILAYKHSPQNVPSNDREKIKKVACTFDLVGKDSDQPWPSGFTIHKVKYDKKGARIGIF